MWLYQVEVQIFYFILPGPLTLFKLLATMSSLTTSANSFFGLFLLIPSTWKLCLLIELAICLVVNGHRLNDLSEVPIPSFMNWYHLSFIGPHMVSLWLMFVSSHVIHVSHHLFQLCSSVDIFLVPSASCSLESVGFVLFVRLFSCDWALIFQFHGWFWMKLLFLVLQMQFLLWTSLFKGLIRSLSFTRVTAWW